MAGTTVRVSRETHAFLREMADQTQEPMQEILARAVEAYRRQRRLQEINAAYAALRASPQAWEQELEERNLWAGTLADGLNEP